MSSCDNTGPYRAGRLESNSSPSAQQTASMTIAHSWVIRNLSCPASADYDVDDCIEVERVKIPSGEGVSYDGGSHRNR